MTTAVAVLSSGITMVVVIVLSARLRIDTIECFFFFFVTSEPTWTGARHVGINHPCVYVFFYYLIVILFFTVYPRTTATLQRSNAYKGREPDL